MDTTRWKSILVPRDMYEEVKFMAKDEGTDNFRTTSHDF